MWTEAILRHDAKWTPAVIEHIAGVLDPSDGNGGNLILVDPMAGIGHGVTETFGRAGIPVDLLWGIEIEPEWAAAEEWIGQGDAFDINSYPQTPCRIFTSIDYGNRMSGNYLGSPCRTCKGKARTWKQKRCEACDNTGSDAGGRMGYAISLNRKLAPANMARNGWGSKWRTEKVELFHLWTKLDLPVEGALVLNVKDHWRSRRVKVGDEKVSFQELIRVSDWCIEVLTGLGFELVSRDRISTPSYSRGQNGEAREPKEQVLVFDWRGR